MFKTRFISMLVLLLMAVSGAWATITVTWNNDDIPGTGFDPSFTKDGVTITAGHIDFEFKNFMEGGTFTTTLGNFTKIEVTAFDVSDVSGTGWSGSDTKKTWTGNASSVSFSGGILGMVPIGGNIKFEFTIEPATVAVTGVTLAPTSATLTLGETETVTLTPTVLPGDATDKSVTWSSSNEAVATVADGVVTAVAAGEATITVTTTDGAKTATCAVTVAAPAASTYTVTLKEGTDDATSWTIAPAEATTTGVAAGTEVTATYGGTKKVKSVKAKKKAAAEPTAANATATDIGKVVCAAGHLHDAKTAVPDGCTAVGILGKVTETGHGLILALEDAPQQPWNTINGWTSVTTYAGTTLKQLPDDAARGSLTSYTTLGSTTVSNWCVAQKSDYEAIFTNLGSTAVSSGNTSFDANVNAYITTDDVGTAMATYYWSASEYEGGSWGWRFYDSNWIAGNKSTSNSLRPVLGF